MPYTTYLDYNEPLLLMGTPRNCPSFPCVQMALDITTPGHWSKGSLVRRVIGPKGHWSERSIVRRVNGPKCPWLKNI